MEALLGTATHMVMLVYTAAGLASIIYIYIYTMAIVFPAPVIFITLKLKFKHRTESTPSNQLNEHQLSRHLSAWITLFTFTFTFTDILYKLNYHQ